MVTTVTNKKERPKKTRRKELFLDAYDKSLGNISAACKKIGIARKTFHAWVKEDSVFADKITEIDEEQIDFSETMLKKNVREGKEASIFFHLKTKGKHRGYVESTQVYGSFNDPWTDAALKSIERSKNE